MKRLHLIEIEDQDWCPRTFRDATTDYLQFALAATKPYAVLIPILATTLQRTGTRQILDLCSGAAGPWLWLRPVLAEMGLSVSVCLTDKYPNMEAFGHAARRPGAASHDAVTAGRAASGLDGESLKRVGQNPRTGELGRTKFHRVEASSR